MIKDTKDIVVIGGVTAWQLANNGEDVLLLGKQGDVYTSGSSLGEARISRSFGDKGDIFSYLQQQGIVEAQKLIEFLNQEDSKPHKMEDIYITTSITYIYYPHQH